MVEESAPADHSRSGGAPSEAPPHRLCDATGIERALESIQRVYGPVVEAASRLAQASRIQRDCRNPRVRAPATASRLTAAKSSAWLGAWRLLCCAALPAWL